MRESKIMSIPEINPRAISLKFIKLLSDSNFNVLILPLTFQHFDELKGLKTGNRGIVFFLSKLSMSDFGSAPYHVEFSATKSGSINE